MEPLDIEFGYIDECLQRGGGRTISKSTTKTKEKALNVVSLFHTSGWNQSFLRSHFSNLDDEMLEEWNENMFVEEYAKYRVRRIAQETGSTNIAEIFKTAGLNSRLANHVYSVSVPLIGSSYGFLHILDSAVEYVLGHFKPLMPTHIPYFVEPVRQNEWIPYKGKQIWNLPFTCKEKLSNIQQYINHHFPKQTFFYHTTNWASVQSIFNNVDHTYGRKCLDFGYNAGFYMSETIDISVEWGKKRSEHWKHEVAIILFQLPPISEFPSKIRPIILQRPVWDEIVKACRDCKRDDDTVKNLDRMSDFIYGPILKNVVSYNKIGIQTHIPPIMQLTSKSYKADTFLSKHLVGALVFRK